MLPFRCVKHYSTEVIAHRAACNIMALIWAHGATILLASCREGPPPQPAQPRRRLEVLAARWDPCNDSFTLEARISIPVADDAELLAGGWVADSETGVFQSYLVFEQNSSLTVGCLDLTDECFELVAEVSLPPFGGPSHKLTPSVQDCWLANGPTVFAMWKGQLLVATSKGPEIATAMNATVESPSDMEISYSEPIDYMWEAHLLAVTDSSQEQMVKILFCGEIRRDACPEIILSARALDSTHPGASSNSGRCLSVVERAMDLTTAPNMGHSMEEMNGPFKLALSEHVPAEVDPDIVSCILAVAAAPCPADVPHDVLIGSKDGRLLRCRHGQIIHVVNLDGTPTQLYFAVVAGGQGVVVVVLPNGAQQNVLAICAESHKKLQDWSGICQVVVGDFTLSGHDQIVLLHVSVNSLLECELHTPLAQIGVDITVIHGFSNFPCPGTPQGSQQHLKEVKAINDHHMSGLEVIEMALHERLQAGLAQLKLAEHERDSKRELYRISSSIMQNMVARHQFERKASKGVDTSDEPGKSPEQGQVQVVQATRVENRICGMDWFLMVHVQILEARSSTSLHHVSLLVTSLNGDISGRSPVLKSLSYREGSQILVTSIPLHTLSLLPGFPVHVFLRAALVPTGKGSLHSQSSEDVHERCRRPYTQWLCCSQVIHPTALQTLNSKEAGLLIERASQQRQFVVAAESNELILELPGRMRSALFMQGSMDDKHEQSAGKFNLMSVTGLGIATAYLCCIGKHAVVTLKTSNAKLMAMLQQSFILLFRQHQFQLLPRVKYYETLKKASMLAEALAEELGIMDSLRRREFSKKQESEESKDKDQSSSSRLQRLQMATDRRCSEVLSSLG